MEEKEKEYALDYEGLAQIIAHIKALASDEIDDVDDLLEYLRKHGNKLITLNFDE